MSDLVTEIRAEIKQRLEDVAERIKNRVEQKIVNYKPYPIRDTRAFLDALTYQVIDDGDYIIIKLWSNVPYTRHILGGSVYGAKMPPLAPIEAWVKRRQLSWVDKKNNPMSPKQMAFIIQKKIHKNGIKPRHVFAEVINEDMGKIEQWIERALS